MPLYQFKREQLITCGQSELWDYISSPLNLQEITPKEMDFSVTNGPLPKKMYAGMIICYRVRPIWGIALKWVTEITHIEEGHYFVDEQRIGPYRIWHHQHHISPIDGGMRMLDIVSYAPPLGPLGAVANALVIEKKLTEIFEYRFHAIEERFGPGPRTGS